MLLTYPDRRNLSACGELFRAGGRWWGPGLAWAARCCGRCSGLSGFYL